MTPADLRALLDQLDPDSDHRALDPAALLAAAEALADRDPRDAAAGPAGLAAHRLAGCADGLDPVIGGVKRDVLVRFDGWSSTWDGPGLDGAPCRVRVIAAHARDPVHRRTLARARQALSPVLPAARLRDDALVVPLGGAPLTGDGRPRPIDEVLPTAVNAVRALAAWEAAGLLPAAIDETVLRDGAGLVCLTPGDPREGARRLRELAAALLAWAGDADDAARTALHGLQTFPPPTTGDAADWFVRALAEHLAGVRHDVSRRAITSLHALHGRRLAALLERLAVAAPPPRGRAAVGADLDGQLTAMWTDDAGALWWGPPSGEPERVVDGTSVDARVARRLLRARAAAPPKPHLHAQVQGTEAYAAATCRWLGSALELRTLRLLLERAG